MTLKPKTPLNGFAHDFGGTSLTEVAEMALVSIATPRGGADALQSAVRSAYDCDLPVPGATSEGGGTRFLGLQQDQVFAMFPYAGDTAIAEIRQALGDTGYYTDQSDSWALLRLSGEAAVPALERICPVDLDRAAFPIGAVARTAMEHLGVIILREETDGFLLMAARSSAANFLHAVEQSVRNVV